jgi:putative colanic acid biosynthesis acetyltransferase WcaF
MNKQAHYNAANLAAPEASDPYKRPSFSLANRIMRFLWSICWLFLYRPSLRPMYPWRAMLLRAFGAKMGPGCRVAASSRIWAPWNLNCEDIVQIGDGTEIYNQAPMFFGSHAIVSQGAYVCGSTHDLDDPAFPLIAYPMTLGAYSWVCARAVVGPGVDVGEGAVLGLASVTTRDLEPWTIYAGTPAVKIRERRRPGADAATNPACNQPAAILR